LGVFTWVQSQDALYDHIWQVTPVALEISGYQYIVFSEH